MINFLQTIDQENLYGVLNKITWFTWLYLYIFVIFLFYIIITMKKVKAKKSITKLNTMKPMGKETKMEEKNEMKWKKPFFLFAKKAKKKAM